MYSRAFFVTAEKPHLGLYVVIAALCDKYGTDFLFVSILDLITWELHLGQYAANLLADSFLFLFYKENSSLLRLGKTHWNGHVLLQTCINGSS